MSAENIFNFEVETCHLQCTSIPILYLYTRGEREWHVIAERWSGAVQAAPPFTLTDAELEEAFARYARWA